MEVSTEYIAVPPKPEGARLGEGEGQRYTEADCLDMLEDYRDACFMAVAWQHAERDPDGALSACDKVLETESRWECFSDVAEMHALQDRERSESICGEIPRKRWQDQCWFGIGLAWSTEDFDYARTSCERAGMWRDFCRHDVNGEIAQVDPQAALDWCKLEQGTLLQRKTCFHGLGKYLGRVAPETALGICDQVPLHEPLYRENCMHGLGWALAEQSGEALSFCRSRGGDYRDSCVLGVSAHAKKLDPQRALEICQEASSEQLRERCLAFAGR